MWYIVLGTVAFLVAGFFDLAALKEWRHVKQVIGLAAVLLFSYSLIMIALHPDKLRMPAVLSHMGWILLPVSLLLLVYSLFLEIPFRPTYTASGAGDRLVRTGTYALVRHPGVLWFALLLVSVLLVSRSRLLLWAGPIWLGLDVLLVWIQDRFTFPRQFPDYVEYQRETPMVLPTLTSVRRCWRTLRKPMLSTHKRESDNAN